MKFAGGPVSTLEDLKAVKILLSGKTGLIPFRHL
jgi:hypothetical protein